MDRGKAVAHQTCSSAVCWWVLLTSYFTVTYCFLQEIKDCSQSKTIIGLQTPKSWEMCSWSML